MFRGTKYNSRISYTNILLDTPLSFPPDGQQQVKTNYKFTVNDKTSFFDWYNGYFLIKFRVEKKADGTGLDDKKISVISDATNFLSQMTIKQNGKTVYDCNNLSLANHVKSLLTLSDGYVNSIGKNSFIYPDISDEAVAENTGFAVRDKLTNNLSEVTAEIPLNRFSFFQSLEHNLLPPAQMGIEIVINNDEYLIFRAAGDPGRVIITHFELWIPRLKLNSEGLSAVLQTYMKPRRWTYLRESIHTSGASRSTELSFRITAGIKHPKHVIVFLQRPTKHEDQTQNPLLLDTFKLNAADNNSKLLTARLEVGSGTYYPETRYSSNQISRIFRDACNYRPNSSNEFETGNMLTLTNFESLYGLIYFDLTYVDETVDMENTSLTLHFTLNTQPTAPYRICVLVLNEEDVILDTIGNDIVII